MERCAEDLRSLRQLTKLRWVRSSQGEKQRICRLVEGSQLKSCSNRPYCGPYDSYELEASMPFFILCDAGRGSVNKCAGGLIDFLSAAARPVSFGQLMYQYLPVSVLDVTIVTSDQDTH